jgi:ABC-2 type transport system permease protein
MSENFVTARALAIARKEVMHIARDPFTIAMAVGVPVILVVFFGFAIDFNFRNIKMAVFDRDRTEQSRQLAQAFLASEYFVPIGTPQGQLNPVAVIESERAATALIIEPGFGKKVKAGTPARVQLLLDGSDNTRTGVIGGYLMQLQSAAGPKLTGRKANEPITVVTRFIYNPELNTQWFVVPGLIVVVTGLLSILLTALTIAREWENGSMEMLLSTPVTPLEVIIGKILPYAALGMCAITLVCVMAQVVFAIPFRGSYLLFGAACALFTVIALAIGLLISISARQQQKAMQASLIIGLMPSLLLSGFIFPIESMPRFFQFFTMLLPQRWFMQIVRGIILKDAGFFDLILPFMALTLMCMLLLIAASKRFKRDIEP